MIGTAGANNSLTVLARTYSTGDVKAIHFNRGVVDLMDFYGQHNKTGNDQIYENPAEWIDAIARGICSLCKANYVDAIYTSNISMAEYLYS